MLLSNCKRCRRLSYHLKKTKQQFPDYFCQPVPAFGDLNPRLLIVGLAPGLHGANATGRPFTGDASGEFLFKALHKFGFSNQVEANIANTLALSNCRITNAVKCLPPQNKPTISEVKNCTKHFLGHEIEALESGSVVLALGQIAHNAVLRCFDKTLSSYPFGHNQLHDLENELYLLDSYHCSRYNTQTKRLTEAMFDDVLHNVQRLIT